MSDTREGLILKGIGGFYYVEAADMVYECKARGIFRKRGFTPYAGDRVSISVKEDGTGVIDEILPRKNRLIRPPVANIDQLMVVAATCEPTPSPLVIDKMLALAVDREIEPVLILSKADLRDSGELEEIYRMAGIRTISFSSVTCQGMDEVKACLQGKITAFTGNSGVGKSSLLNCVEEALTLETGEISQKLGRGRHTTRQVELFPLANGGYVADTPGFSTVDIERYEMIDKENLPFAFPEFAPYLNQCKFTSCVHVCEKGCAVLEAVEKGEVSPSRHASYVAMYDEVKDRKEWEKRG